MATKFTIPVVSYRRIDTPFNQDGKKNAIAVAHVKDLPDLSKWREINPRVVNRRKHVAQAIEESFMANVDMFLFLNRGLVMTVERVDFDPQSETVTIYLDDPDVHGLLDGGHTYEIVMDLRTDVPDQYVKLEFLQGFDHNEMIDLAGARNTSMQVKDKSLANLEGKFDRLKDVISDTHYYQNGWIAWKENEEGEVDVRELLSYLYPFHIAYHDDQSGEPTQAYVSKAGCLDHFKKYQVDFERSVYPIAKQIFELWDHIHVYFPIVYNAAGGSFGGLGVVGKTKRKKVLLPFINQHSDYVIPSALKYPILAAFRAFVEIDESTGEYYFGSNPVEALQGPIGEDMMLSVAEIAKQTKNANHTGKSNMLWRACHSIAKGGYSQIKYELHQSA